MKTTDLFKFNRSSKGLNESMERVFGKKIDFSRFDTPKLEDARNKLRTQISQLRSQSGFNEAVEGDQRDEGQGPGEAAALLDQLLELGVVPHFFVGGVFHEMQFMRNYKFHSRTHLGKTLTSN